MYITVKYHCEHPTINLGNKIAEVLVPYYLYDVMNGSYVVITILRNGRISGV